MDEIDGNSSTNMSFSSTEALSGGLNIIHEKVGHPMRGFHQLRKVAARVEFHGHRNLSMTMVLAPGEIVDHIQQLVPWL